MSSRSTSLLLLLGLAACADPPVTEPEVEEDGELVKDIPVVINRDVDLLFVIDDSSSMRAHQGALAAALPAMIDRFAEQGPGLPSLHLGVISADALDAGRLQPAPRVEGCAPPAGRFLEHINNPDGTHTSNYDGTLAEAFACIATLGSDGSGIQRPFAMVERALDGSVEGNAGFLRDDAYLVIVFVTDEDDGAGTDPEAFVDFLRARKGESLVALTAIVGDDAPRIESALDRARLSWVTRLDGDTEQLAGAIAPVGDMFKVTLGAPCLDAALDDVDPGLAGVQPDCVLSEIAAFGTAEETEEVLPLCNAPEDLDNLDRAASTNLPCWHLAPEPAACAGTPGALMLVVERGLASVPAGTQLQLRCVTE